VADINVAGQTFIPKKNYLDFDSIKTLFVWFPVFSGSLVVNIYLLCLIICSFLIIYYKQIYNIYFFCWNKYHVIFVPVCRYVSWFMVFNTTFNNISVIAWRSVLMVEETRIPGENHWPVTSHWQTSSHNIKSSTPRLSGVQTHDVSGHWHWWHR